MLSSRPIAIALVAWMGQAAPPATWLDRALANWNSPGGRVAAPPQGTEPLTALAARCSVLAPPKSPAADAVAAAGWLPYLHLDRELRANGIEVIGGTASADAACQPLAFNIFVFAAGHFAGVLSPVPMTSGADGAAGAVRLLPDSTVSAEFVRYANADSLCCPSSRVTVRFRITVEPSGPVLLPIDVRTTRG